MTQLDKLKQAAEIAIPNIEGYEDLIEHDVHIWIKGATSEAARDYWSSDAIEFVKWLIADETQLVANPELNEQLYQEFLKQKQNGRY